MKKFLSNTIVQLLIAVIIGLLAGFVVNDAVLEVVICIKHITGQIIFFLVPLIILGFIAPSIAHLRSNASKMLLFAFSIAYLSSIGASFFGAAVGYNVIPFLHVFIAANFCILSYQGAVTKQLPVFLSVLIVVIVCHFIWLSLLYFIAAVYSRKNSWQVLKYYGPAYLTALGTMSSAATLGVALECARKSPILRKEISDVTIPLFANIHLCGSILTETVFVLTVSQMLYGSMPSILQITLFILLLGLFAIGAPGVPGGTVLASLGLIISVLHFNEAGTALLLTIFALQDSFGTACNITGDGALTLITDTFEKR